jgi:hypothetical protein
VTVQFFEQVFETIEHGIAHDRIAGIVLCNKIFEIFLTAVGIRPKVCDLFQADCNLSLLSRAIFLNKLRFKFFGGCPERSFQMQ